MARFKRLSKLLDKFLLYKKDDTCNFDNNNPVLCTIIDNAGKRYNICEFGCKDEARAHFIGCLLRKDLTPDHNLWLVGYINADNHDEPIVNCMYLMLRGDLVMDEAIATGVVEEFEKDRKEVDNGNYNRPTRVTKGNDSTNNNSNMEDDING